MTRLLHRYRPQVALFAAPSDRAEAVTTCVSRASCSRLPAQGFNAQTEVTKPRGAGVIDPTKVSHCPAVLGLGRGLLITTKRRSAKCLKTAGMPMGAAANGLLAEWT